jgi:hypothetical protein
MQWWKALRLSTLRFFRRQPTGALWKIAPAARWTSPHDTPLMLDMA